MSFTVTILPTENKFTQYPEENILQSALHAGHAVSYGCANGNCGECKAKLIDGEIEQCRHHDYVVKLNERQEGLFLMCAHRAKSDLIIETTQAYDETDIPLQRIPSKIKKIESINDEIKLLHLQTPRTKTLRFLAGQQVKISHGEHVSTLALANCPCDERNLMFHIKRHESEFADFVFDVCKPQMTVDVEGPYGNFLLETHCQLPSVFIAYETGFAPIKSLIEHSITLEMDCPQRLFLLSHHQHHYMWNMARTWRDAMDDFNLYPILLTDIDKQCVQIVETLIEEFPSLSGINVYLSATPEIVKKLTKALTDVCENTDYIKIYTVPY